MKIVQDTGSRFDPDDSPARTLIDELLSRPLFAHLATVSESVPRESPVWFLWENEALWIIGNYRTDTFPSRLEREPRCAVGIVDFNVSTGLVRHVGFRGKAFIQPHDQDRAKRLLSRYLGAQTEKWDARFVKVLGDADYIFVRFQPETAVVRDQSYTVSVGTHV